jgi:putative inorganic carbon (HCO3(-)) transporter
MQSPAAAEPSTAMRRWMRRLGAGESVSAAGRYQVTTALAAITCALAPAYTVRWHVGPLPTTVLENAILLTIAVFVIESITYRAVPVWRTRVTLPAIVFLAAGAISVLVPPDHRAALGLYRAYLIEPIAFGLVIVNTVTTPRRALLIGAALCAGGAVAGIANSVVIVEALRQDAFDVTRNPPSVIYFTANAVPLYLVPLIALAGAVALHWPGRNERLASGVLAAVGAVCVVISFSRGGYLALAVVAFGLALSHRLRWYLLGAGAVAGAALLMVPQVRRRVVTEMNFNDPHNTLVGRSHLWDASLQMLRDHPIFGAGLSGFAAALAPYWNATHPDRYTYPHNILLNFWTETGLLGVLGFAWILYAAFAHSWGAWRDQARGYRPIHLGVLLAMVAVVIHGLVDVPYWKNDLSFEFWALLGLTFAVGASAAIAPETEPRGDPAPARREPGGA